MIGIAEGQSNEDGEEIDYRKVSLEKFKLVALQYLPEELLCREEPSIDVSAWSGYFSDQLVVRITKEIWGREMQEKEVRYPLDWWEAIKERWAPQWFKNRWPVDYVVERLTARELYTDMSFPNRSYSIVIMGGNIPDHMDRRMVNEAEIKWLMRLKAESNTISVEEIGEIIEELLKRMGPEEVMEFKDIVVKKWRNL